MASLPVAVFSLHATSAISPIDPPSVHLRVFGTLPLLEPPIQSSTLVLVLEPLPGAGTQPGLKLVPRGALLEQDILYAAVQEFFGVVCAVTVDVRATKSTATAQKANLNMLL